MEYLVNGVKYATIEEAQEAEKKLEAEKAKKETALAEKKAELAKINEDANSYLKLISENDKKRAELRKAEQEAYATYKKAINEFAKKNQGYHLTYKVDGDNGFCWNNHQHHDNCQPSVTKWELDFCKSVSC